MTAEDIAAFHEKFATMTTVAAWFGLHRNAFRLLLEKSGIRPLSPAGTDSGAIWLLDDVRVAFLKVGYVPLNHRG